MRLALINYGLPFQTHVDEMTIVKDPFKLAFGYLQGDFSSTTNLYNWLLSGWFGLFFLGGLIAGKWHALSEFKTFLVSDSYEILLFARVLSMMLSLAAVWILLRTLNNLVRDTKWWWSFALLIVFNPIDLNSTSWVKFDAAAFLSYSLIIHVAHQYFFLEQEEKRGRLYLLMLIAMSIRIEMISYLAGLMAYDLFVFRRDKTEEFWLRVKPLWRPFLVGVPVYLAITLYPISLIYKFFRGTSTDALTTSPTFEKAIVSKIPINEGLWQSVLNSDFYVYCFVALLGPFTFYALLVAWRDRRVRFLYFPLLIMIFFIVVFPSKGTHYLLNISVISLFIFAHFVVSLQGTTWQRVMVLSTLAWVVSISLIQVSLIVAVGDVRMKAAKYLLDNTTPDDRIYYEGVFSQIQDKPYRYAVKAQAARATGSTGLSNDYFASHLSPEATRYIKEVTSYDPFEGSDYEGRFNNAFNFDSLVADHPKYYVFVGEYYRQAELQGTGHYASHITFYDSLISHSSPDSTFDYPHVDPRLRFATSYYFRPVVIYKLH